MTASTARFAVTLAVLSAAVGCIRDEAPVTDTAAAAAASDTNTARRDSAPASRTPAARPDSAGTALPSDTRTPTPVVVGRPACARPVTVTYYARGGVADVFVVTFGAMGGAPADSLIDALARKYDFTPTHRYQGPFSGFSARLSLSALAGMRCEASVTRISQVVIGGIGTPATPPPQRR